MPTLSEHDIQRAFVIWFGGSHNLPPAKLPGVEFWHTPNGGTRDAREGKRLKESGTLAGIPDIFILWGRLYGLEFKKPGGRLSPAQIELHPRLVAAGALVATVDNLADAKRQVIAWGLTVHTNGDKVAADKGTNQ